MLSSINPGSQYIHHIGPTSSREVQLLRSYLHQKCSCQGQNPKSIRKLHKFNNWNNLHFKDKLQQDHLEAVSLLVMILKALMSYLLVEVNIFVLIVHQLFPKVSWSYHFHLDIFLRKHYSWMMVIINVWYSLHNCYTINMIYPLSSNQCIHLLFVGNQYHQCIRNKWVMEDFKCGQILFINLSNQKFELMLIANVQILMYVWKWG